MRIINIIKPDTRVIFLSSLRCFQHLVHQVFFFQAFKLSKINLDESTYCVVGWKQGSTSTDTHHNNNSH